jgi:hypothetical protein
MQSRRRFLALACGAAPGLLAPASRGAQSATGRALDLKIAGGFGSAAEADVRAVLSSAAGEIWRHCPATSWQVSGFYVYHNPESPITLFDHTADGRIAIGLNSQDTLWSQYAFQFAHEFCHALAGHSDDWRQTWIRGRKANNWLEESLCETASLFALRAMGKSWEKDPPYTNWRDYSASLTSYVADRLAGTAKEFPAGTRFIDWFHQNQPAMRETSTLREKNNQVAAALLPVFEADPAGWESVTFINRVAPAPENSLQDHFRAWHGRVPAAQRAFVAKLARVFEISLS